MKKIITLCSIMLLASYAFGQNLEKKLWENSMITDYLNKFEIKIPVEVDRADPKINNTVTQRLATIKKQQMDSVVLVQWDSVASQWVNNEKEEYVYNAEEKLTLFVNSQWNAEINQWKNEERGEYTYDDKGNELSYVYRQWNTETNQLKRSYQYEYTYDANNNETLRIYSTLDTSLNQLKKIYQYEYTYDANGYHVGTLQSKWDSIQWVNYLKYEYIHDADGRQIKGISMQWDSSQWVLSTRTEIAYDDKGRITMENLVMYMAGDTVVGKADVTYADGYMSNIVTMSLNGISVARRQDLFLDTNGNVII